MKRRSFMLSGVGAALVNCGASPLAAHTLLGSGSVHQITARPFNNTAGILLGSLLLSPYDFVPQHFEPCEGQIIPIKANVRLFSLIGNTFGGGRDDFALPDMRGHAPLKGLSYLIAMDGIYPNRKNMRPDFGGTEQLLGQLLVVPYLPQYVPPRGWAACDGQLLNIRNDIALYSLIGTKFGGDGMTTFGLPDLRKHQVAAGLTYLIALNGRFPSAR